jgi:hypothetical protein
MTSVPPQITSFPRGHEFPPLTFTLSEAEVAAYLEAVGDRGGYDGAIPPLAVAALALAQLQTRTSLPDGTLHVGQEVEHAGLARAGEALTMQSRVAQRSERQGMVVVALEFDVEGTAGAVLRARSTIMSPGGPQ